MCRTTVESSLIRPGLVDGEYGKVDGYAKVASVQLNEERLHTLKIAGLSKAKGIFTTTILLTLKHNYRN